MADSRSSSPRKSSHSKPYSKRPKKDGENESTAERKPWKPRTDDTDRPARRGPPSSGGDHRAAPSVLRLRVEIPVTTALLIVIALQHLEKTHAATVPLLETAPQNVMTIVLQRHAVMVAGMTIVQEIANHVSVSRSVNRSLKNQSVAGFKRKKAAKNGQYSSAQHAESLREQTV